MAGTALGQGGGWGKGHCQAAPGLLSQRWHRTARSVPVPLQVTPLCPSRHFQGSSMTTEKERQGEASPSFHRGCSGVLRAGLKVHRDKGKGRVRGLEGGGHCGGAPASSQQRDSPQKRPLELHREGEKEQEEEKGSQWQLSGRHRQTGREPGWRWLGCCLTGCRLQPGLCQGVQQHPKVVLWG